MPRPSLPLVLEQPGGFEYLEVPCCRRPGVFERIGNLAGGHRPSVEIHRYENPPAHRVSERREHRLVRVLPLFGFVLEHRGYLACRLNVVKAALCNQRAGERTEGTLVTAPPR